MMLNWLPSLYSPLLDILIYFTSLFVLTKSIWRMKCVLLRCHCLSDVIVLLFQKEEQKRQKPRGYVHLAVSITNECLFIYLEAFSAYCIIWHIANTACSYITITYGCIVLFPTLRYLHCSIRWFCTSCCRVMILRMILSKFWF